MICKHAIKLKTKGLHLFDYDDFGPIVSKQGFTSLSQTGNQLQKWNLQPDAKLEIMSPGEGAGNQSLQADSNGQFWN